MNFEHSLKTLESIIEKLESGSLSLEDSLKHFEEGVKLTRQCQTALKEAEQKVNILIEQNGEYQTQPFSSETAVENA